MKTENVERRIIKWERVWMIIEKRKMEREMDDICYNCEQTKKSKIVVTAKPKRV